MARTCRRNRQKMFYTLPGGVYQEYELNDDGTIKEIEVDGELIKVPTGQTITGYLMPVEFHASISSNLSKAHAEEYGISQSSIYSELLCNKGEIPLEIGALVWKNSIPELNGMGFPNPDTADYRCMGVMDEFQDYDWFLLERVTKTNESF